MSSTPPASYFLNRPPDYGEGGADCTHELRLWLPDVEYGGFAVVDYRRNGKAYEDTSPFPGANLLTEVHNSRSTYSRLIEGMPEVYQYLGVSSTWSETGRAERVAIQFCHPQTFVERLGALPLDTLPAFWLVRGEGQFGAVGAAQRLADNGEYSMAFDGYYAVHDLVTHGLPAQILTPPQSTDYIRSRTREALSQGDAATKEYMDQLDLVHTYFSYGSEVAGAIQCENTNTTPRRLQPIYPHKSRLWEGAALTLHSAANASHTEIAEQAAQIRNHCVSLRLAAAQMLQSTVQ